MTPPPKPAWNRGKVVGKKSDLNNPQASEFVDKRTDFVGPEAQGLIQSRQEPCNFEP
jgi:hypothetical protein